MHTARKRVKISRLGKNTFLVVFFDMFGHVVLVFDKRYGRKIFLYGLPILNVKRK